MDATLRPATWRHLLVLLGLSIVFHGWIIAQTAVPARDSIGFARLALHLESPPTAREAPHTPLTRLDVIRQAMHPPGYPLLVLLVSQPIRACLGTTCESMTLSCQVTAGLAGVLLILPMYLLARRLFSAKVAFWATGLFQILPVFAQISSDGLSDSLYLLLVVTTVWRGVLALQQPSALGFLLFGLGAGLAYLVRPEGLLLISALGLVLFSQWLRSVWRFRVVVGYALMMLVGMLVFVAPYVQQIGKLTNKPTGVNIIKYFMGEKTEPTWHSAEACAVPAGPPTTILGTWWNDRVNAGESRLVWATREVIDESFKAAHYLPGVFILIGMLLVIPRRWREPGLLLPVLVMAVYLAVLWVMAAKIGYVSERHTLPMVMLGCLFAGAAVAPLSHWVASWALLRRGDVPFWRGIILAVLVAVCLPGPLFKPLHAHRVGHRHVGLWLRAHTTTDEIIWDPFCWAEFYANRAWGYDHTQPRDAEPTVFVILEETVSANGQRRRVVPHSRLPSYRAAIVMASVGRVVYQWPERPEAGEKVIAVYRIDR